MKIDVPIISQVDVLFAGISVHAVSQALELKKKGISSCFITAYSYPGEEHCAFFDLQSPKDDVWKKLIQEDFPTPNQLKCTLEKHLINADIPFYYQTFPVQAAWDEDGKLAGLLCANRSGFQLIESKIVVDATERNTAAKICGVPVKTFKPGICQVERFTLSQTPPAPSARLHSVKLPRSYRIADKDFYVWHHTAQMEFADNSAKSLAEAEKQMRELCWTPTQTYAADQCKFQLNDGIIDHWIALEEIPVFLCERSSESDYLVMLRNKHHKSPVKFKTNGTPGHQAEIVRKDTFFRFKNCDTVSFDLNTIPLTDQTDVLVCGGGTGGAPAMIAAGREKAKVIGLEALYDLGGICTLGRICSYWFGNRVGFTEEMAKGIFDLGENPKFSPEDSRADLEWKKEFLLRECCQAQVDLRFGTLAIAAAVRDSKVCGVVTVSQTGPGLILAKNVIDASGNADITAYAGGETVMASPDEISVQGAAVTPIIPDCDYSNYDYQFICDHDVLDFTRSMVMARGKFTDHFDVSPIADTRERRRIVGDITLQPQDFYAHRCYHDTINIARSNFDTHGFVVHPMFLLNPTSEEPHFAKVPLRALLSRGLKNVITVGLAVSAHRDCIPLIRMQPDVQNHGYAAGLAAAIAAAGNKDLRDINIRQLQEKLIAVNCLPPEILQENDSIPGPDTDNPHCMLSNVFLAPQDAIPALKRKYQEEQEISLAALLAFLKQNDGAELLEKQILESPWDEGWDYRGMGQFGMSSSPLDVWILALSNLEKDTPVFLQKLERLQPDHSFSHFRAVCMALIRHPRPEAAGKLEALLSTPGMSGFAINSFRDTLLANRAADQDTTVRNSQLKEIYLAKALSKCDPQNALAGKILQEYSESLMGYFCLFAQS